ncbi:uncharacterized protein CBL_08827 [Carabus blaptoides fortunei]
MDDSSQNNQEKRKNRKRKKTFLSNARKYAKKGTFGRGSHLSEDTYQYFVRVLEIYKEGFPSEEEKLMFANNVFEQTENEEINYSSNQIGCRVIETLLPFANAQVIERFTAAFSSNLRLYLSDRFASHVIQALLQICCEKSLSESEEPDAKAKYKEFTFKISKFLLNNLEDFISDTYANHIIRSVFESLAGIPKEVKNEPTKDKSEVKETEMPEEYTNIVREYSERLIVWPQFKDLPYSELSSGMLQILLKSLKKIDLKLLKKVQKKLLEESFSVVSEADAEEKKLPDVFQCKPATMLLEMAITVATEKTYTQIYAKCFVGNLVPLAKMRECNFTVQKLLNACMDKTEFEQMFDELASSFEDILVCGHSGVILAIGQTCKRLSAKQGNFIQSLMNALHCSQPVDRQNAFVSCVMRLVPYERLETVQQQHYFVNLHGSFILQVMLEFNKPIKIINSILNMEGNDLKNLFCDSKGSHIMDSYMKSQYVGEKSREKLIRKMQGTYQELAVSKYGSRSLEAILNVAQGKQKMQIMDELSYKDASWTSAEFGRIIAGKINIQLYKRNKDEWKTFIGKSEKTKNMFADIIGENV